MPRPMTKFKTLTLIVLSVGIFAGSLRAQTVTTFEGIDASEVVKPEYAVDANGAVGTKQFMEYTNVYFQAYDKVTFAPVWSSPQSALSPWQNNGVTSCNDIVNDAMVIFDRLALRWVIAGHTSQPNNYNYCVAVSNTDDLSSPSLAWYTYVFPLNSVLGKNPEGQVYFPDWPKIATWSNGYYVAIDLNDMSQNFREVGVLVCALDRADMLVNAAAKAPICLGQMSSPVTSVYLGHSLIPADVEGTTPPPAGRDEFLTAIENPVLGGGAVTSNTINLWDFHVDWTIPANSTLTESSLVEAPYQPGCYTTGAPANTICVPEPSTASTGNSIDSVGDRFMPRMSYRNFGSYESFLVSHTVQASSSSKQTAIRWYELRDNGSGEPSLYQDGNVSPDESLYRFMPSIAEDAEGNAAVGYNVSSSSVHPGMNASYFSLVNSSAPTEITLFNGTGDEENTWHMGSYSSMTVDPEDGCTFWYVNQYFPTNQTGTEIAWGTRIANFAVPGCGSLGLSPNTLTFSGQAVGTTSAAQKVTLTNSQDVALTISGVTLTGTNSGDFAQTNNCVGTLNAGASCTVNVTFTPTALGTRTAVVNVNDDGANSPQTASLTGTGIVPVTLSSSSISFGSVLTGSRATAKPVTLTNNQSVALTGINVSISGSSAYTQVNTCGSSLAAGGKCTITVTFAPTTTGAQTGTVNITDSASNSPQTIALMGSGMLPMSLNPGSLTFSKQKVGTTSAPRSITVTNHEKVTVTFDSITITGTNSSDFAQTNTCTSVAAGGNCTVKVTFSPTATGTRTATLTLTDTATNSPQTAKLSGTGD